MKKRYISIIAAGLCIALLAGCQKTSKETITSPKDADSIKSYESVEDNTGDEKDIADNTEDNMEVGNDNTDKTEDNTDAANDNAGGTEDNRDNTLRETLGAPEHYTNQATYEGGSLIIDTDADVILPEVGSMNTYAVSAKEVNQDMIDTVSSAFFEEAKFYSGYTYSEQTKEEVKPSFGLEHWSGEGEEAVKEVDEYIFYGVAETDQGNYDYNMSHGLGPDIGFGIFKNKKNATGDVLISSNWTEGSYILDEKENGEIRMTEDDIKELLNISLEDAQKIAEEKVEKLGWGLELYNWEYSVFHNGDGAARKDTMLDAGYLFHFTRKLDGVPVTFTDSYGGELTDMDSTLEPWGYERCDIIVGDDGIQKISISNPYDVAGIQAKNVKLMDFDSIVKIYEQMMGVSNTDIVKYETNRTCHIKRIVLGYSRIYDPTANNSTGLLVPVWDFFGGVDITDDGYAVVNNGEHSNKSLMTINAIDGAIINRELGY